MCEAGRRPTTNKGSEDHIRADPGSPAGGSDGRSGGVVIHEPIRASPRGGSGGRNVGASFMERGGVI